MTDLRSAYFRISPDQFHFLKFILEGYDNLAILSSFNKKGVVVIRYPKELEKDLYGLLDNIAGTLLTSSVNKKA